MRYKVVLANVDDSIEVNAEDFEVDADTRSIIFFNHGKTEDAPDISVAWFPIDKVEFVTVRSNS